jgi:hypothetical protein
VEARYTEDRDTRIQFYKYIGNKYPSVNNLILDGYISDADTLHTYNECIFPLYQKIESQVDTFLFSHYYDGLDAFRKFDDYGMKLNELTIKMDCQFDDIPFIEELAQSQQSKCIQKLILDDIILDPIHRINNFEVLNTLDMSYSCFFDEDEIIMRREINFTQLIDACPATLTTLSTAHIYLTFSERTSTITNIKHLKLIDVDFTLMLANIIETSFPKLSTLTLAGDIESNVTISLLKHKLKKVSITALYNKEKERNEYTVESKCENGIQYYSVRRTPNNSHDGQLYAHDGRAYPSAKTEPSKSFTLKFICPSVEQLFFFVDRKMANY